jgi:hypothetical protein
MIILPLVILILGDNNAREGGSHAQSLVAEYASSASGIVAMQIRAAGHAAPQPMTR